jgi:membrane associated rhomboid family serine protease
MRDAPLNPAETARREPIVNAPMVVVVLILAMVAVHVARLLAGERISEWALVMFSFIPAEVSGRMAETWPLQRYWTFLTYAFLHGNGMHLFFNGLWLLIFGSFVARRLPTGRFLLLSAVATISAAAAMLVDHWGEVVPVIGASGMVSGYMAAAVPLMYGGNLPLIHALRRDVRAIEPLSFGALMRNRGALIFMAVWLLITLATGAVGFDEGVLGVGEQLQIAWEAHIGGFLGGLFAFYLLDRKG